MSGYEAYEVFAHLRDTGTIQAFGEMLGQAFAQGLAKEAAKSDAALIVAAPEQQAKIDALADALEALLGAGHTEDGTTIIVTAIHADRARAALREAGRKC